MRKVFLFMMISLDGFFEGPNHDLFWHTVDDEFNQFAAKQMQEIGTFLFGRRTYQLMEEYWPNEKPENELDKIIRDQMDNLPKYVYSKTLTEVKQTDDWQNVTLCHEVDADEIKKLKEEEGYDIAVFGSSNLCISLLKLGLLDELRIMVSPTIIGDGTRLFEGLDEQLKLKLTDSRIFKNGNVLLTYQVLH